MHKKRNCLIGILVVLVVLVGGYFSFFHKSAAESKTVTVGVVDSSKADTALWKQVAKDAKDKYGVTVKTKQFSDYNQPNKALENGDIDLNAFQHQAFLDEWNQANHGHLVAIGKTVIAPIRLFSAKYHALNELPDGATIAIPNDATNGSRALYVLKNAGLITFKKGTGKLATVADIKDNKKNLKIKEMDASQTARTLNDVDAAVVNNTYANAAKLSNKDVIYTEPVNKDSAQWINIIVAKKDQANNQAYKDVVKAYQTKAVKDLYHKYYGDTEKTAWDLNLK